MVNTAATRSQAASAEVAPVQAEAKPKRAARKAPKQHVPKSPAAKSPTSKAAASPKIARTKAPSNHPTYLHMVIDAISAISDRRGASSQSILKYIKANHKLVTDASSEKHIKKSFKTALLKGVSSGVLSQATGKGVNGRFQIKNKNAAAAPKKTVSRAAKKDKAVQDTAAPATPTTPKMKKVTKKAAATVASPSEKKVKSPTKAAKPAAKRGRKAVVKSEPVATTQPTV